MAIETVDLPIKNGDFPWFFCMLTRPGKPRNMFYRKLRISGNRPNQQRGRDCMVLWSSKKLVYLSLSLPLESTVG